MIQVFPIEDTFTNQQDTEPFHTLALFYKKMHSDLRQKSPQPKV